MLLEKTIRESYENKLYISKIIDMHNEESIFSNDCWLTWNVRKCQKLDILTVWLVLEQQHCCYDSCLVTVRGILGNDCMLSAVHLSFNKCVISARLLQNDGLWLGMAAFVLNVLYVVELPAHVVFFWSSSSLIDVLPLFIHTHLFHDQFVWS